MFVHYSFEIQIQVHFLEEGPLYVCVSFRNLAKKFHRAPDYRCALGSHEIQQMGGFYFHVGVSKCSNIRLAEQIKAMYISMSVCPCIMYS